MLLYKQIKKINKEYVKRILSSLLKEDTPNGDPTTTTTISKKEKGKYVIRAREKMVFCGSTIIKNAFTRAVKIKMDTTFDTTYIKITHPIPKQVLKIERDKIVPLKVAFSNLTDSKVQNLVGTHGAYASDALLNLFGVGSIMIILISIAWGGQLFFKKIQQQLFRLVGILLKKNQATYFLEWENKNGKIKYKKLFN